MKIKAFASFLLEESIGALPCDWLSDVENAVSKFGISVQLDGTFSADGAIPSGKPTRLMVVSGDSVRRSIPWLYEMYQNQFLNSAQSFANEELVCSRDLISSININVLEGAGAAYERHADCNSITGLLFAATSNGRGGELVLELKDGEMLIEPRVGQLVVFDGHSVIHSVRPLTADWRRISIPMNFHKTAEIQPNRRALNNYLYGSLRR